MYDYYEQPAAKPKGKRRLRKGFTIDPKELKQHLRESFFPKPDPHERFSKPHNRLIHDLTKTGVKGGVKTDLLRYKDKERAPKTELPLNQFALVHLTDTLPEKDGILHPTMKYDNTVLRDTTHLAVNSAVGGNVISKWQEKQIAVVVPLEGATHWVSNLYSVDSFGIGPLKLPQGTIILVNAPVAKSMGLHNGQEYGRARIKIVDLSLESHKLNQAGIITKSRIEAIHEKLKVARNIPPDTPQAYNLLLEIEEKYKRLGYSINNMIEGPMHFAVVKELLHQGKLPFVASMWDWAGWQNNSGLRLIAEKYGFTQTPHNGTITRRLEERSIAHGEIRTQKELITAVNWMRRELNEAVRRGELPQRNIDYARKRLKKGIANWARAIAGKKGFRTKQK